MHKLLEKPNEQKLENAELKINNLQVLLSKVANEGLKYKTENKELKTENNELKTELEKARQENLVLESLYEKFRKIFPTEADSILQEVKQLLL